MTIIQTYSGKAFDFINPTIDMVCIEDIAHSLSMLCRYTGHIEHHYSVAQHSILVCDNLPRELQLEGLLHDAVEAYVQDVSEPLKMAMRKERPLGFSDYDVLEKRIDAVIVEKFGLTRPLSPSVKRMDRVLLASEIHAFNIYAKNPALWKTWEGINTIHIDTYWDDWEAEEFFLDRFETLTNSI